jgi:hypothetical protein
LAFNAVACNPFRQSPAQLSSYAENKSLRWLGNLPASSTIGANLALLRAFSIDKTVTCPPARNNVILA